MRTTKLISAALAAGALLAPATASAARLTAPHRHLSSGSGACTLTETAEPHMITSGEPAQVYGTLVCGGVAATGQSVTVYQRSVGSGLTVAGTATTGAAGFYQVTTAGLTTDSSFYAVAGNVQSPRRVVKVAPAVTGPEAPGHPDGSVLYTGRSNLVTFVGTVSPADRGAIYTLQRESSSGYEEWHAIQNGFVGPGGVYVIKHRFSMPGDANLRVVIRRHGIFSVRGISSVVSYEIAQAENPRLTLNVSPASADPIKEGSSVTLSGKVLGASNAAVTLWARNAHTAWAPIATSTTDGSGDYAFLPTPKANTFYRVQSGAVSSAVLFEGVKYLLTANVSATTVQAGQPLTFAGTVAPALVGKAVYIERQNSVGTGFHVVDVGAVASGGTYSITDEVFGTGTDVLPGEGARRPGQPVLGEPAVHDHRHTCPPGTAGDHHAGAAPRRPALTSSGPSQRSVAVPSGAATVVPGQILWARRRRRATAGARRPCA